MTHPMVLHAREVAATNPAAAERDARRRARAGRAQLLGLHVLPGLVLAELLDHRITACMPRGTGHVTCWLDAEPWDLLTTAHDLLDAATEPTNEGALVMTLELRRARWWHRALGDLRVAVDRWRRWRSERAETKDEPR